VQSYCRSSAVPLNIECWVDAGQPIESSFCRKKKKKRLVTVVGAVKNQKEKEKGAV
jgi:hypothetical protein